MADMEIVRQFNSELSTLYATKPPISKAKVTTITRLALKAAKFYKHVVQSLEKFVQKCRPEYKIPALYVVDSIIRQSRHQFGADKDVFGPRFGRNINNSFQNFFKCLPEEQSKLIKVLNLWQKNKVYSPEVIQPLLNMAHTRPMTEQQGSPKLSEDVKAVPADTTQLVVDHMAQHQAPQQPTVAETPQEQAYIAMLRIQQEEQMKHIRELEERLQRQQQMSQQFQQPHAAQPGGQDQAVDPARFQLPTEVFAQIQALTGLVNQPGVNPPGYAGEQYGGNPPDQYVEQQYGHQKEAYPPGNFGGQDQHMTDQNYQQTFRPAYEEPQQENNYMASQQHQGFVDDFDYGDDQDDAQRIEEKKRQLEQEANRLNTKSSYERDDTTNARQRMEEEFRQQQQLVSSSVPPQVAPESQQVPEVLQPPKEAEAPVFQAEPPKIRSRSRSPRDRKHRDNDREPRDSDRERDRERGRESRDKSSESSDRNRQRNRDERDRSRGDREDREKSRGERDRSRSDRDERERSRVDREGREKTRVDREERDRSRGDRDEREKPRVDRDERERPRVERDEREKSRDERERPRERERGRESDKESDREKKEEKPAEEKKEEKVEKWVPPVKEEHMSVCSRTIWLGKIVRYTSKEMLEELFQEIGEVQLVDVIPPRGCAYVQMAEREAAYRSLSSRQILKQNFKLAWAPAKGVKEYKEHFDKELGVTYIPFAKLEESEDTISSLSEGGWIDPRTIPESLRKKEEAAAAASAVNIAGQLGPGAPVLGMPMGPPPFSGMPPGLPRFPMGMPGLPMPGVIPPGMNIPGFPGMQFPPGLGNPFQRLPMNNQMPFMPRVNPFMIPGLMPGMRPGGPMPNMPGAPFFRGNAPPQMTPPSEVNKPPEQDSNKGEATAQSIQSKQDGPAELQQGENVSAESGFQAPPADQVGPEGQNVPDFQNGQEAQVPAQFGDPGGPGMGPEGGPSFQGGPPFHGPGGPQFRPPFGPGGGPPFHGRPNFRGPPSFHDQGGPRGPWRPEGRPWQHEGGPNENWGNEGEQWGHEGEQWGNEGEQWGHEGEQWGHERPRDRPWGRGNEQFDRRGRRHRGSQDEQWGHEEPFNRQKRGRFDDDWGPPNDRRRGQPFDHRGRPQFGRDHPPFDDRFGPPGRGPPFPMEGPPHGRDGPPHGRDGPPHGRDGPPHGRDGPPHGHDGPPHGHDGPPQGHDGPPHGREGPPHHPPFDDRPPWMHGGPGPGGRWGEEKMGEGQFQQNPGEPPQFEMQQQVPGEGARHGGDQGEIPSLMAGGPEADAQQSVAAPEAVAKGWAEINALKARLAVNKGKGTENNETAAAPAKEGKTAAPSEETKVGVPSDVTADPVKSDQDKVRNDGEQTRVPYGETKVGVPTDQELNVGELTDVSSELKVEGSFPIPKSEQGGEAVKTDAIVDKPGSMMVPEASTSHEDEMNIDKPTIQGAEPGMKGDDNVHNVGVGQELEPVVQSGVGEQMRSLGDTKGSEVIMGSFENRIGSEGVMMGSEEVKMESVGDSMRSEEVKMGSEDVKMGSENVKMVGHEENKVESVEDKMGSEEIKVGSMEDTMGSKEVMMGSEEVDMGSKEVRMGSSEEVKMESVGDKMRSEEIKMGSDESKMGSVETTNPENGKSNVFKLGSESETTFEGSETVGKLAAAIALNQDSGNALGAVEVGGVEVVSHPVEKNEFEQSSTRPEAQVQQQEVTSSETTPAMGEEISKPEHDTASIDAEFTKAESPADISDV